MQTPKHQANSDGDLEPLPTQRRFASLLTAVQFGLGLHLTALTTPSRVVQFLVMPFHRGFDPTLVFVALGALPTAAISYHYGRGEEKPRLGGKWGIPKGGVIDRRLLVGAAIFGIGWGVQGLCRKPFVFPAPGETTFQQFARIAGPVLVNLGITAIQGRSTFWLLAGWLVSFVLGGALAEMISL